MDTYECDYGHTCESVQKHVLERNNGNTVILYLCEDHLAQEIAYELDNLKKLTYPAVERDEDLDLKVYNDVILTRYYDGGGNSDE